MKGEGKKCRENWSESASVLMEIEVGGIVLVFPFAYMLLFCFLLQLVELVLSFNHLSLFRLLAGLHV